MEKVLSVLVQPLFLHQSWLLSSPARLLPPSHTNLECQLGQRSKLRTVGAFFLGGRRLGGKARKKRVGVEKGKKLGRLGRGGNLESHFE